MKMLRYALEVTRLDKIKNRVNSGVQHMQSNRGKNFEVVGLGNLALFTKEGILYKEKMQVPGKRRRGRPKRRFLDEIKEGHECGSGKNRR